MVVAVEIAAPPTPLPGDDSPRLPSSAAIERNDTVTGEPPPSVVVVVDDVEVVVLGTVVDVVVVVVSADAGTYVTSSSGRTVASALSPVAKAIRSAMPFPLSWTSKASRTCVRPLRLIAASSVGSRV